MHKRIQTLCIKTGGLLGAGLFYAFICILAGHPLVPCLFHTVTGLYCPGCGVSRMCLSILSLDFASAFKANAAVFLLLPPGLVMALRMAVRYVRTGNTRPTQVQTCVFYVMVGVLLVFGVVRNLPGFEGLRP